MSADADGTRARRIAVVDGASFALPYDHELVTALARRGDRVTLFASATRYNAAFLEALAGRPGVQCVVRGVSGTVASRPLGVLAYAGLLLELLRRRRDFDVVNLQWSVLWPLELAAFTLLRRRFVWTVHNAVPHGFAGARHRPTLWLARLAQRLVFPSEATRDAFVDRYGAAFAARSVVLRHGLLPPAPGLPPRPPGRPARIEALVFWSTVKPYKGVELFEALAASPAVRERGLALEVHGRWDASLSALKARLAALGVRIEDRYLEAADLGALFARDGLVFVLPHQAASQSGAFYTLLHQGRIALCGDAGDLGRFLRAHALEALLLEARTPAAVLAALDRVQSDPLGLGQRLARAQAACDWDACLADAADAY